MLCFKDTIEVVVVAGFVYPNLGSFNGVCASLRHRADVSHAIDFMNSKTTRILHPTCAIAFSDR